MTPKDHKRVFITVGTTSFDKLIGATTSDTALQWMQEKGFTELIIQYGNGQRPDVPPNRNPDGKVEGRPMPMRCYDFLPTLQEDMQNAELIISHAGAGTVMEALRLRKRLVVVINTDLMDNHQAELAEAMAERGHLFVVDKAEQLNDPAIWRRIHDFVPTVQMEGDNFDFPRLLDSHLGFPTKKES